MAHRRCERVGRLVVLVRVERAQQPVQFVEGSPSHRFDRGQCFLRVGRVLGEDPAAYAASYSSGLTTPRWGSLLVVMLLHGSQNASNGLITRLATASGTELTTVEYYLISTVTFGALVAILTRGRLGTHPHYREESAGLR